MLDGNSGAEFCERQAQPTDVLVHDVQYALQLLHLAFGDDPDDVEMDLLLFPRFRRLSWCRQIAVRLSQSHEQILRNLISKWAEDAELAGSDWRRVRFGDLLKLVKHWRERLSLGEEPWSTANQQDLQAIATWQNTSPSGEPVIASDYLPNRFGGLNLGATFLPEASRFADYVACGGYHLLSLCAREWLTPGKYHSKYYSDLGLDEAVLSVTLNGIGEAVRVAAPTLLRPEDEVPYIDVVEDVCAVSLNALEKQNYSIRRDLVWLDEREDMNPLLGYHSVYYITILVRDNIL